MASKMETDADEEPAEEIRKKRIEFLKAVLNIYRSRRLSSESICETLRSDLNVPDEMLNFDVLRKQIRALHNDITHLKAFRDSVKIIHSTVTCQGLPNIGNIEMKMELRKSMSEISFFSQTIMKMFENFNQIEVIRRIQEYSGVLLSYQKNLKWLKDKEKQSSKTVEELKRLEKAELQIKKINFMRDMKHILIGKFARNYKQFPMLQQFRVPHRKALTIEDFTDTLHMGLK